MNIVDRYKKLKNSGWFHYEFNFDVRGAFLSYLCPDDRKRFFELLKSIDNKMKEFRDRRFFLFEPNPHCFFAMELKDIKFKKEALEVFSEIKNLILEHEYITTVKIKFYTTDFDNGDNFLNMLNVMTDYNFTDNAKGLAHIFHCCLNSTGLGRLEEEFWENMAKKYNTARLGKVVL